MAAVGTGQYVRSRLSPEAAQCVDWIEREQDSLETVEFGTNKRSVEDALKVLRHKVKVVDDYKGQVNKVTRKINNEHDKATIQTAYDSLKFLSEKRLQCLQNIAQIAGLEELFGSLTYELADKATTLVTSYDREAIKVPEKDGERIPHSSQTCILAVRNNWNWITKLVRCTDVHVKHIAEYHQYFHDLAEYEHWLPTELRKLDQLVLADDLKGNREDASRLLSELKMVLTIFLTWQGKTDSIFDRAKRVVPVHLRSRQLDHPRPVTSLCNYKTNDILIQEGEELVLLDNKMQQSWLVRSLRSKEAYIPAVICLIPPPDTEAVSVALRFRLKLLGLWTCHVKRIGKTLIYFLLLIFRDWNKQEEEVLKALPDDQKEKLIKMCDVIEDSLVKYWSGYPDFKTLQARFSRMRTLLRSEGDPKYRNSEMGRALIVQIGIVEELLRRYKDLWSYWETYKIMVESCRHSEMMLICSKWEELKFIDTMELLKHWHTGFGDDKELMHLSEQGMEEVIEERTANMTEMANGTNLEGEIYNVERALETAEAEHITSAEQEEKKTFVITGVIDPATGAEISLDEAVRKHIIDQQKGTYVNAETRSTLPIPVAMNAGWIKVEYTTTKKGEEKRRDIGLITIKTQRESRPYTVRRVKDIKSDRMLSVDEAMAEGLIDFKRNQYRNRLENSVITIADALDSGLLDVDIDSETPTSEPQIDVKTYAIYAVVDQSSKKSVSFGQAVRLGLIDPDTGSYHDTLRHEQVYVGDAIKRGFIKASVVTDPNSLDIDPQNREVIEKMQKKLSAMKAVHAFKKSVGRDSDFGDLSPLGDIEPTGDSIFDRYLLAIIEGVDFLSSEEYEMVYISGRAEDTAMPDLDEKDYEADIMHDQNVPMANMEEDENTEFEFTETFTFDSSCSIFQGFFSKISENLSIATAENNGIEGFSYEHIADAKRSVQDVPSADNDKDSKASGESKELYESGEIRADLTELESVSYDTSSIHADDGIKPQSTGENESFSGGDDDEPDYRHDADSVVEPTTIMLEGLTGNQIMGRILRGFLEEEAPKENGKDKENEPRRPCPESGLAEMDDKVQRNSAESDFLSTSEDVTTNTIITSTRQNEPQMDGAQQEATVESDTVENTNNNVFVTEEKAPEATEINFDDGFRQTDFQNSDIYEDLVRNQEYDVMKTDIFATDHEVGDSEEKGKDPKQISDETTEIFQQRAVSSTDSSETEIQSKEDSDAASKTESTDINAEKSEYFGSSSEVKTTATDIRASDGQKIDPTLVSTQRTAVVGRNGNGDGIEKDKDHIHVLPTAAERTRMEKEEEQVVGNVFESAETDAASEKGVLCVSTEENWGTGTLERRKRSGIRKGFERKKASRMKDSDPDSTFLSSKMETSSRSEAEESSTRLHVSKYEIKTQRSALHFNRSQLTCINKDKASTVRRYRYKLVLEAEIDFDVASPPRVWRNICSGCLPFWLLLLLLLFCSSLMYVYKEECGCMLQNNHKHSMDVSLSYYSGPPPY